VIVWSINANGLWLIYWLSHLLPHMFSCGWVKREREKEFGWSGQLMLSCTNTTLCLMSRGENSYTVQYNHDRRPKKYKWSL